MKSTSFDVGANAVVQFKIKENDAQNKTEALKIENDFINDMQKVYDEVNEEI